MLNLHSAVGGLLVLAALLASLPAQAVELHPDQERIDILSLTLDVEIDLDSEAIPAAIAKYWFSATEAVGQLVLNLDDNDGAFLVSSATLKDGTPLTFTQDGAANLIFVTLPTPLSAGENQEVWVYYSGDPANIDLNTGNNRGIDFRPNPRIPVQGYRRETHAGEHAREPWLRNPFPIIFTATEIGFAHLWFPCKEDTKDKFFFEIEAAVRHPGSPGAPYVELVSNGTLLSNEVVGDTRYFHRKHSYPISPEHIFISCTNYQRSFSIYQGLGGEGFLPVEQYIFPWQQQFFYFSPDGIVGILEKYAPLYGEYPFILDPLILVSWPDEETYQFSQGVLPIFIFQGSGWSAPVEYMIAAQWLGSGVELNNQQDFWLHQALFAYSDFLIETDRSQKAESRSARAGIASGLKHSSRALELILADPNTKIRPSNSVTWKGGMIIHMLRKEIADDDLFIPGFQAYTRDPAILYKTTTLADFVRVMEEATGRDDLRPFLDQWITRAQPPAYEWSWREDSSTPESRQITLGIRQVQDDPPYDMPIDFRVALASGSSQFFTIEHNSREQVYQLEITSAPLDSDLDNPIILDFFDDLLETNTWIEDYSAWEAASPFQEGVSYTKTY